MLSRYQIKSTQLPKPSTKSIESNAIHFTCAFLHSNHSTPSSCRVLHAIWVLGVHGACECEYWYTKTLLYSLHPIAPPQNTNTQLNESCQPHGAYTAYVLTTIHTLPALPLEIWMMILFHILYSTINNHHNNNNNNDNHNEIHGLSKIVKA